jgi:hypothetical protein
MRHGGSPYQLGVWPASAGSLTPQAQDGTGRYRYLIPIGNGFVKHHEQRKIEFGF